MPTCRRRKVREATKTTLAVKTQEGGFIPFISFSWANSGTRVSRAYSRLLLRLHRSWDKSFRLFHKKRRYNTGHKQPALRITVSGLPRCNCHLMRKRQAYFATEDRNPESRTRRCPGAVSSGSPRRRGGLRSLRGDTRTQIPRLSAGLCPPAPPGTTASSLPPGWGPGEVLAVTASSLRRYRAGLSPTRWR